MKKRRLFAKKFLITFVLLGLGCMLLFSMRDSVPRVSKVERSLRIQSLIK